jgi:hypothetical protein
VRAGASAGRRPRTRVDMMMIRRDVTRAPAGGARVAVERAVSRPGPAGGSRPPMMPCELSCSGQMGARSPFRSLSRGLVGRERGRPAATWRHALAGWLAGGIRDGSATYGQGARARGSCVREASESLVSLGCC